jgi:hypothetical protein
MSGSAFQHGVRWPLDSQLGIPRGKEHAYNLATIYRRDLKCPELREQNAFEVDNAVEIFSLTILVVAPGSKASLRLFKTRL